MNRAWCDQRVTRFRSTHRRKVEQRYLPPMFNVSGRTWYSKKSVMGYMMAKGIYWSSRYHTVPIIGTNRWSLQG